MTYEEMEELVLAARLGAIAQDIVDEYSSFRLYELLDAAATLSTERPNLSDAQYQQRAAELKRKAQEVVNNTVFRTYPIDTIKTIDLSGVARVLPSALARVVLAGFPASKTAAISSAEVHLYKAEAQAVLSQISGFLAFSQTMGVEPYAVPPESISLEIKFPRPTFDNSFGGLGRKITSFDNFFKVVAELRTGSRQEVDLIYTSTTDPILSLSFVPAVALGILMLYKLLLEVAEKQINVVRLIRDLRSSGLSPADDKFDEKLNTMIKEETAKAVESFISCGPTISDEGRKNEIKTELARSALIIVPDIAAGTRIYIGLESQQQIKVLSQGSGDIPEDRIREEVEATKDLETKLDRLLLGADDGVRKLLRPPE